MEWEDSVQQVENKMSYRPLPKSLTIKPSNIDGLGLFATEFIEKNTFLGVTHVYDDRFEDGLIRTPLGGFFNHSETPNIELKEEFGMIGIVTIKDINKGEEITGKYTIYDPTK